MFNRKILFDLGIWRENPERKPLILRGARQVGKTTVVKMFSEQFDYFINLNLDKEADKQIFDENRDVNKIIQILFFNSGISQKKNDKILIFIDEIQNSANAIKSLRYFYEERNELFVIAAGSLLETLLDNQISFPVGRVEYKILRPFSFCEFLEATENINALAAINSEDFPDYAHDKLLELFNEYSLIGGMPEVIETYVKYKDLVRVSTVLDNLIVTYLDDIEKYSSSENQTKIIRFLITNSIKLAGERIKFEGFAHSNYKSKDVGECLRILEKTFLLSLNYPTSSVQVPIMENIRKSPKIQFLDTGIVNKFAGLQASILSSNLIDDLFEGKIAEHIVGQELLFLQKSVLAKNTFWVREKKQSNAEVDYLIQINDMLIPVEVKAGKTGRLRSLMAYVDAAPHNCAIRVYSGNYNIEYAKTLNNKDFILLNLPFYLINRIYHYAQKMLNEGSI
ncbi:MAG: AAA family ATPase [Bacteroidales bacterium]|nr:AAA family ATPase [Bacteroidales bacterium]